MNINKLFALVSISIIFYNCNRDKKYEEYKYYNDLLNVKYSDSIGRVVVANKDLEGKLHGYVLYFFSGSQTLDSMVKYNHGKREGLKLLFDSKENLEFIENVNWPQKGVNMHIFENQLVEYYNKKYNKLFIFSDSSVSSKNEK